MPRALALWSSAGETWNLQILLGASAGKTGSVCPDSDTCSAPEMWLPLAGVLRGKILRRGNAREYVTWAGGKVLWDKEERECNLVLVCSTFSGHLPAWVEKKFLCKRPTFFCALCPDLLCCFVFFFLIFYVFQLRPLMIWGFVFPDIWLYLAYSNSTPVCGLNTWKLFRSKKTEMWHICFSVRNFLVSHTKTLEH